MFQVKRLFMVIPAQNILTSYHEFFRELTDTTLHAYEEVHFGFVDPVIREGRSAFLGAAYAIRALWQCFSGLISEVCAFYGSISHQNALVRARSSISLEEVSDSEDAFPPVGSNPNRRGLYRRNIREGMFIAPPGGVPVDIRW